MSETPTMVGGKPLILLTGDRLCRWAIAEGPGTGRAPRPLSGAPPGISPRSWRKPQRSCRRCVGPGDAGRGDEGCRWPTISSTPWAQGKPLTRRTAGRAQFWGGRERRRCPTPHLFGRVGDRGGGLSPHLQSRQEVGEILRTSGVQTIEFRASIVIGSGSLSFDMIRALVERLPIMITRWVSIQAQPIAVTDLVQYLLAALGLAVEGNPIFEIGGADRMSYRDIMREYARQRGLRRLMIPVPVLTPRLSSLWLGLVTPLYARVGRNSSSMRHPTIVHEASALQRFGIQPKGIREAIALALRHEDRELQRHAGPTHCLSLVHCATGGSALRQSTGGFPRRPRRCPTGAGICSHPTHRWCHRLVLWQLAVAIARVCGCPGGRRRDAPRATCPRLADRRGYPRLVARGGV